MRRECECDDLNGWCVGGTYSVENGGGAKVGKSQSLTDGGGLWKDLMKFGVRAHLITGRGGGERPEAERQAGGKGGRGWQLAGLASDRLEGQSRFKTHYPLSLSASPFPPPPRP